MILIQEVLSIYLFPWCHPLAPTSDWQGSEWGRHYSRSIEQIHGTIFPAVLHGAELEGARTHEADELVQRGFLVPVAADFQVSSAALLTIVGIELQRRMLQRSENERQACRKFASTRQLCEKSRIK